MCIVIDSIYEKNDITIISHTSAIQLPAGSFVLISFEANSQSISQTAHLLFLICAIRAIRV